MYAFTYYYNEKKNSYKYLNSFWDFNGLIKK